MSSTPATVRNTPRSKSTGNVPSVITCKKCGGPHSTFAHSAYMRQKEKDDTVKKQNAAVKKGLGALHTPEFMQGFGKKKRTRRKRRHRRKSSKKRSHRRKSSKKRSHRRKSHKKKSHKRKSTRKYKKCVKFFTKRHRVTKKKALNMCKVLFG